MNNQGTRSKEETGMLTGMFRDRENTENAYRSLKERGYTDDDINVLMSEDTRNRYWGDDADKSELGNKALEGTGAGGAIGGTLLGILTQKYGVRALTVGAMVLSTVAVAAFGQTTPDLQRLSMICAVAGFCLNGAIVGLYALFAKAFPTHVRATGTGFAIGCGRGGAVIAPVIAGYLFQWGYSLPTVAMTMAAGSLLAAGVLLFLKLGSEGSVQPATQRESQQGLKGAEA